MARAILPDLKEPWAHELEIPLVIAPQQYFVCRLIGTPFPVLDMIDVMILLDGLTAWAVQ